MLLLLIFATQTLPQQVFRHFLQWKSKMATTKYTMGWVGVFLYGALTLLRSLWRSCFLFLSHFFGCESVLKITGTPSLAVCIGNKAMEGACLFWTKCCSVHLLFRSPWLRHLEVCMQVIEVAVVVVTEERGGIVVFTPLIVHAVSPFCCERACSVNNTPGLTHFLSKRINVCSDQVFSWNKITHNFFGLLSKWPPLRHMKERERKMTVCGYQNVLQIILLCSVLTDFASYRIVSAVL